MEPNAPEWQARLEGIHNMTPAQRERHDENQQVTDLWAVEDFKTGASECMVAVVAYLREVAPELGEKLHSEGDRIVTEVLHKQVSFIALSREQELAQLEQLKEESAARRKRLREMLGGPKT